MIEKNTNIKERVLQFAKNQGISIETFLAKIGMTYGSFRGKAKFGSLNSNAIVEIYTIFPQINIDWLLTGKGEMLKNVIGTPIELDRKALRRNMIPLFNDVATIGGKNALAADLSAVSHTVEYVDAGDWFPGATEAIRHYGDSMVEYPSGSILALKKVEDIRLIIWGQNYCIETNEYRITKRLNRSQIKDFLVGYSTNTESYIDGSLIHEPIEIPLDCVRAIYKVVGCVTKEYSSSLVEFNSNTPNLNR